MAKAAMTHLALTCSMRSSLSKIKLAKVFCCIGAQLAVASARLALLDTRATRLCELFDAHNHVLWPNASRGSFTNLRSKL